MPPNKKRRQIVIAAATANVAGAGAGFLAHALGLDLEVSTMVGTFVGGTVGEGLLQVVAIENSVEDDVEGTEDGDADEDGAQVRSSRGAEDGGKAEDVEAEDGVKVKGAEIGVRHGRHVGHRGYARCTRRRTDAAAHVDQAAPARTAAAEPQHAQHRHLHRGAQRFVTRVHGRNLRSATQERRHGAS